MAYKSQPDVGVAGSIATTGNRDIDTYIVENVEGIAFGLAVAQGSNDTSVRAVKTGDTHFKGITALDLSSRDDAKYQQYDNARIMHEGVIWVEVTEDVKADDQVAVDLTTGKFNKSGAVFANAYFKTSSLAGGLAQVRLK